ncbi:MAG: hypothetical protein VYD18_16615 [Candidatus Latescibacterota bacterium]|nr:hypothetical protein [Candidatus Latescibacterota bacterium]
MVHSPSKATYTVSLYAEYGLRDDLTLIAYAPFFQRITLNKQVGRESEFVYFGGDDAQGIAEVGVSYACGAACRRRQCRLGSGLPIGDGEFNRRLSLLYGAPCTRGLVI